ncbi:MAG: hypothetical protein QOC57_2273 [Ilumatobacteraceae bacterium]|jgi:hypothetical protein
MKAHRFDPVSFVLGVFVIAIGIAASNARLGNLINNRPDALLPLLVLGAGLLTVGVATRRIVHGDADDRPADDATA